MKIVVITSANAEWEGVTPLFSAAKIESYPYGECFLMPINELPIRFFHTGWGKLPQLARFSISWIIILPTS